MWAIKPALDSVRRQTHKADAIYLSISDGAALPAFLGGAEAEDLRIVRHRGSVSVLLFALLCRCRWWWWQCPGLDLFARSLRARADRFRDSFKLRVEVRCCKSAAAGQEDGGDGVDLGPVHKLLECSRCLCLAAGAASAPLKSSSQMHKTLVQFAEKGVEVTH